MAFWWLDFPHRRLPSFSYFSSFHPSLSFPEKKGTTNQIQGRLLRKNWISISAAPWLLRAFLSLAGFSLIEIWVDSTNRHFNNTCCHSLTILAVLWASMTRSINTRTSSSTVGYRGSFLPISCSIRWYNSTSYLQNNRKTVEQQLMLPEVNACRLSYVSVFRGCSPVVQGSKILFKVPWSVARNFLGSQPNFNSQSWRWRRRTISPKHRHNESPDLSSTSHKVSLWHRIQVEP